MYMYGYSVYQRKLHVHNIKLSTYYNQSCQNIYNESSVITSRTG